MPQRKQILWSQLKVGILTVVSLILLAIGIFLITGRVGLFTKTMTIETLAPDAGGLKTGAPVRLTGVDVGTVRAVQLSGLPETSRSVEIVMEVSREYQSELRTDSEAFLAAEGLLGERYINISRGTANAPLLSPGGMIPFHATAEFSELVGGSRDLIDNLNVLTTRLNTVLGSVELGEGTFGKLINDDTLYRRIDASVSAVAQLVNEVTAGQGSLGQLISSNELYDNVNTTVKNANDAVTRLQEVADQIEKGEGTVGKLLRDPSLYQRADQLVERGSTLVDNINQGKGTLGKLAKDEELYRRLNNTTAELENLLASLQKGEGTMGRLLHDPSLYENLSSTSVEVRELLADFRQNPKKFLTIHFRVF